MDANVVLRYLLKDHEEFYRKAENLFNDVLTGKRKVLLLHTVVAEVVYVLQKLYRVDRKEISEVLKELLKIKNIKVSDKGILLKALDIFAQKSLDFVDSILCAYSSKFTIASFDKDIEKCT
ncbi:MAG: type II toxin-antitoxin system VapC family toxin [Aquificae bacterium]|nr:type II toxin-antitoxin system VapC family toxin [Aquificota bacterium]